MDSVAEVEEEEGLGVASMCAQMDSSSFFLCLWPVVEELSSLEEDVEVEEALPMMEQLEGTQSQIGYHHTLQEVRVHPFHIGAGLLFDGHSVLVDFFGFPPNICQHSDSSSGPGHHYFCPAIPAAQIMVID